MQSTEKRVEKEAAAQDWSLEVEEIGEKLFGEFVEECQERLDEGEGGMQTPPGASGSLERHSPQGRRASEGKMPWLDLGKSAQGMLTPRALFRGANRPKKRDRF